MTDSLKQHLNADVKDAMRSKDKPRLAALRLMTAAIKQREVDDRVELQDADITAILDKMAKQRRESISAYEKADRQDLVAQEAFELDLINSYLPKPLSDDEIKTMIKKAIDTTGASEIKDMGKVMGILKPQMQGRADMGNVSNIIKKQLSS